MSGLIGEKMNDNILNRLEVQIKRTYYIYDRYNTLATFALLYFEKELTVIEKNQQILDSIKLISKQEKNIIKIQRLQKQIDSIKINQ